MMTTGRLQTEEASFFEHFLLDVMKGPHHVKARQIAEDCKDGDKLPLGIIPKTTSQLSNFIFVKGRRVVVATRVAE
jgi:hypothetical protein